MADCFLCRQKQAWLDEKLEAARTEAKAQAIQNGETMALVKQGCNYLIVKANELTVEGTEFISKFG